MTQVIDTRVIEKDARPQPGAVRPTFKVNISSSASAVVACGNVVVIGSPVRPVERHVSWDELPSPITRRIGPADVQASDPWQKWLAKLERFRELKPGWNSYTAPAPSEASLHSAGMFLTELRTQGYEPTRVAPSAMGGVAITRRQGDRKGFVEFYNDGKVYALFSNRKGGMRVVPVQADSPSFRKLIVEMREYLNG